MITNIVFMHIIILKIYIVFLWSQNIWYHSRSINKFNSLKPGKESKKINK